MGKLSALKTYIYYRHSSEVSEVPLDSVTLNKSVYSTRHVKRATSNFGDRVKCTKVARSPRTLNQLI